MLYEVITRLVAENGIIVFGVAALAVLWLTQGSVTVLVVLYAVSVFLTFSVSLWGLTVYWWTRRKTSRAIARLALSVAGFVVCGSILALLISERFDDGGWAALALIAVLVAVCVAIRRHYDWTKKALHRIDEQFDNIPFGSVAEALPLDPREPTAVFMVGSSRGGA